MILSTSLPSTKHCEHWLNYSLLDHLNVQEWLKNKVSYSVCSWPLCTLNNITYNNLQSRRNQINLVFSTPTTIQARTKVSQYNSSLYTVPMYYSNLTIGYPCRNIFLIQLQSAKLVLLWVKEPELLDHHVLPEVYVGVIVTFV